MVAISRFFLNQNETSAGRNEKTENAILRNFTPFLHENHKIYFTRIIGLFNENSIFLLLFYNKSRINIFCVKLRLKGFKRDFVKVFMGKSSLATLCNTLSISRFESLRRNLTQFFFIRTLLYKLNQF